MKIAGFTERLNTALDKAGFLPKQRGRIQQLAELMGLTHRGAGKWLSGETCPPTKKLARLADKLNVREDWLRTGEGDMINAEKFQHSQIIPPKTAVPVYPLEQLNNPERKSIESIECNVASSSQHLFAVKLDTEAMSPRFPQGTLLICDEKKTPKDGDFVLINFDTYPLPIFRQLFISGGTYYLFAHNPKFDRLVTPTLDRVLGVMIQAIISIF
ncbi:MAG: XRE family transcriptional regulator [Pseudomonadota bacterium]